MISIDETSRIERNESIPTGVIGGEMVALDLVKGDCFGMDAIGTRIWALAESSAKVSTIVDQLTSEFEVDRPTCSADVLAFLTKLAEAGLIRRVGG